jgi:hypothetical protein
MAVSFSIPKKRHRVAMAYLKNECFLDKVRHKKTATTGGFFMWS